MTETVEADAPDAISRLGDVLVAGGVAIVPTDTVYGLAACPDDAAATQRIYRLKGRAADVPLAVLCSTAVEGLGLAGAICADAARLAARYWPGPLTLVLPRRRDLDWHLGEPAETIGIRCPDHPLLRAVTGRIGPIAVTSANRHGDPTPVDASGAAASLTGPVDLVVDGGTLAGRASTVVSAVGGEATVLRAGPLELDRDLHPD